MQGNGRCSMGVLYQYPREIQCFFVSLCWVYNISAWTSALLVSDYVGNAKALRCETSNRLSFTLFFYAQKHVNVDINNLNY